MEKNNAVRFRAGLTKVQIPLVREMILPTKEKLEANPEAQPTPGKLVPSMNQGPSHIWAILKEFHQSNNKANLFLLHSKIENFQQD